MNEVQGILATSGNAFAGWERFHALVSTAHAKEHLRTALGLCHESPIRVLPCIELVEDAPRVTRLHVFTESYLCEVEPGAVHRVRFLPRHGLRSWTLEATDRAGLELAAVTVESGPDASITMRYAGDDRAHWLELLAESLPVRLITHRVA
jgi:hypothetical protein